MSKLKLQLFERKILNKNKNDAVIGFGGGSPIDTAKAIAVLSQHSENIQDYKPPGTFDKKSLPIIAIPTTAGTGSEVTHHSVIIDTKSNNHEKISCRGEAFVPIVSIVDYELTLSKPKRLTIDSAIDTLTHGIEAYVSKKATLFSDRMALDTIRLVTKNIYKFHIEKKSQYKDNLTTENIGKNVTRELIRGAYACLILLPINILSLLGILIGLNSGMGSQAIKLTLIIIFINLFLVILFGNFANKLQYIGTKSEKQLEIISKEIINESEEILVANLSEKKLSG